jgi:phthalate 4,5-dioxygenase oxygenase subunit
MKAGNFTGISGFPNQDVAMWVSMGADRRPLATSASAPATLAIVEFRRQMLDAVKAFASGRRARQSARRNDADRAATVCAFQASHAEND